MSVFSEIFTWWNGQTIGTRIFTSRKGRKVGEDEEGNLYYQTEGGVRRWVVFNGPTEATRVSPDWHGWLHHTYDEPPTEAPLPRRAWEKPHKANLTGTPGAYAPPGSLLSAGGRPKSSGDYDAWTPGD